ncbi:MAG TPA: hypothetical protein VK982_07935 [Bacteroidales bacterium]|nr:hypothetical protein [Bacteroidales bacterium]
MLYTSIRVFLYDNLKNDFDQILIDTKNQKITGTKVLDVETFSDFREENYYNSDFMDINVLVDSENSTDFNNAIKKVYEAFNQRSIPIYDFVGADYATQDYGNKISNIWISDIEISKLEADDTYRKANLRIFYNEVRKNG